MLLIGILDKIIRRRDVAKIQILALDKAKITIWDKALWAQSMSVT